VHFPRIALLKSIKEFHQPQRNDKVFFPDFFFLNEEEKPEAHPNYVNELNDIKIVSSTAFHCERLFSLDEELVARGD
jgi:hypothetical protein